MTSIIKDACSVEPIVLFVEFGKNSENSGNEDGETNPTTMKKIKDDSATSFSFKIEAGKWESNAFKNS